MAKNYDPVTLEMTWGAAEAAARKYKCTIQDLITKQVMEMMPHGSYGCVNAFFRQVRIQDLDAQKFDLNIFSPSFKATIVSEIRRFVDNAVETERMESRVTEEMFDQSCEDLDAAQDTIVNLQSELKTCNSGKVEEIRRLELELADARARLAATEEFKATIIETRDAAVRAHDEAREEMTRLTQRMAEMDSELSAERSRVSSLQERLAESECERETAAQRAALAEQRATHAESIAGEQREMVRDLRDELSQSKIDQAELQNKTVELLERLGQAETRAAVAEAWATTEKKSSANGRREMNTPNTESGERKPHS